MSKEVLKLALEALDFSTSPSPCVEELQDDAIAAIKEALAQPEQERNLKLMPREATPEMLKAMDECSTEGYDERLYEGHAGSVYMAAWDAFHGQHCYCGDITNLGVIHRDDGPCHYPDHKAPEQEPVAYVIEAKSLGAVALKLTKELPVGTQLYTTPPQRKPLTDERIADIVIEMNGNEPTALFWRDLAQAIEAAHGIKE